jgi:chemotaxis protein methyltransferase CheR
VSPAFFLPHVDDDLFMTIHADSLSSRDLNRVCRLIYEQSGITLGAEKKIMLEGRLKRRVTSLQLSSYKEYCDYLFEGNGHDVEEMVHLIDAVSTNKTDFFREKTHFEFLVARALPELTAGDRNGREIMIWSAGCSTGEEPYTLAIVLSEYRLSHPAFRFRILATDISTTVLHKAEQGVFSAEVVRPVPANLQRKYFMRSRNRESNLLRVIPELREMIEFRRLNLMEEFGLSELADAIFCRNVIIYFDRPTQERLFHKFSSQLVEGGYMFVGHSESLHHMDVPLVPVDPAVYRKADGQSRN